MALPPVDAVSGEIPALLPPTPVSHAVCPSCDRPVDTRYTGTHLPRCQRARARREAAAVLAAVELIVETAAAAA